MRQMTTSPLTRCPMNACRMLYRQAAKVTLVLLACLPGPAWAAMDFQPCLDCHQETIEKKMQQHYLHFPFTRQQCGVCHDAGAAAPAPQGNPAEAELKKNPDPALVERRNIRWLEESTMPDTSHWFLVPGEKAEKSLIVEVRENGKVTSRQEIDLPPLSGLPLLKNNGRPPVISDVQVQEVRRGVFLSTTIGWRTDTLTRAMVRYGVKEMAQTSPPLNRIGLQHQVILYNLKPDRTYRFSVVANDLFGRNQAALSQTFSTTQPLLPLPPAAAPPQPAAMKDVGLSSRFQRIDDDYLVELKVVRPSTLAIGVRKNTRDPKPGGKNTRAAGATTALHEGFNLNSRFVTSFQVCAKCHKKNIATSHPVNVFPKRGMVIPPEYPTLPDGRITCMTCHEHHASNNPYRLIKAEPRDLCRGCHRDIR